MRASEFDPVSTGIHIFRASRLEALLAPLDAFMRAAPPEHALAPYELVAAHPGMRRWLGRELARRAGPRGVAANLRIELPGTWLDRLAGAVLGEAVVVEPWRRDVLRWRIHAGLGELHDARLDAYLAGEATTRARRRFQLADRLARIFTQYLVYRPDWLEAWAAGRKTDPEGGFLASLWQRLHAEIGAPHRGERVRALTRALDAGGGPALASEPLHVFGVAHLAPSELAVFEAVARHRPVILYVPDPCREYWGGLRSDRARLREAVQQRPDDAATEQQFLEQGHPLLAAWGRLGQHFVLALDDCGARLDERHFEDTDDAAPGNRLQGVQESIRRFEPDLLGEHADEHAHDPRADASLRVHACHTRLRELEVLRDALLDARSADPTLNPADIVVMTPDIHAYLPLLPAVFGAPGRHDGPLPWHAADVASARAHPLFEAFRRLLDLPLSRLTAPEVADLLAIEPLAARLGLGEGGADIIKRWLEDGRVAWALDAAARARFGVPAIDAHTFDWGMERLVAGYLVGETGEALELPGEYLVAPLTGAHGPQAALLGALDGLLVELAQAAADADEVRPASVWAARLERRIDVLFRIDPRDPGARDALAALRSFVHALAREPAASGLDPDLEFSVVRELLLARLDGVPEQQRFLLGGVTFCGMVPQRTLPFRVVAVLGLDDGAFPRQASDGGLDLMRHHHRLGDRDVRSDDRYLFLETVMAARDRLHLSYLGQGVRDGKPRNPAAPLAELMAALDAAAAQRGIGSDASELQRRPWLVRHPLQPFDARYFDGRDPALFSFRAALANMHGEPTAAEPAAFVRTGRKASRKGTPTGTGEPVALGQLLAYYRDPARHLLADRLKLRLDALGEARLRESEPLAPTFDPLDTVARRLFLQATAVHPHRLPDDPPNWLRLTGLLPPGRAGDQAWAAERDKAQALLAAVALATHPACELFAAALPEGRPVQIDRVVHGQRVQGELREVFDTGTTRWVLAVRPGKQESALDFRDRIPLFLSWALLRLDSDADIAVRPALVVPVNERKGETDPWSHALADWDGRFRAVKTTKKDRIAMLADLEQRVDGLLRLFVGAAERPAWYFPRTSWAALESADKAMAAWCGDEYRMGERDYGEGYAALLAGERDFSAADDFGPLLERASKLAELIRIDVPLKEKGR